MKANTNLIYKRVGIVRFFEEFDLYVEGIWIKSFKSIQELRSYFRKMRLESRFDNHGL